MSRRSGDAGDYIAVGILYAVMVFVILTVQSFLVMLATGALHANAPEIPSLSYFASTVLVMLGYLLVWPATATARAATR